MGGYIILIIIALLVIIIVTMYNKLIVMRARIKNAWAQIEVQLKRRYDLIPNLVETAKGYMAHEKTTLENVIKARQQAIDAKNLKDQAKAENFLSQTLRSLFAVSENYPNLKANENMMALQEELTSTENKISFARQFYNDMVMRFNQTIQSVPYNVLAGMFNFKMQEYFELEEGAPDREPVKVKF